MLQLLQAPFLWEHPHGEALLLLTYNCNFPDGSSCLCLPSSHRTPPVRAWPCLAFPLPLSSCRLQHGPHLQSSEGTQLAQHPSAQCAPALSPCRPSLHSRLSAPALYKGAQSWAQHSQGRLTSAQHGAIINCNNSLSLWLYTC